MSHDPVRGTESFRRERFPRHRERFRRLVEEGQSPETLFIGCADSRVMPALLTGAAPGDLFVARNVGALIPPFDPDGGEHGTAAAVEYAVGVLEVSRVVVCGHSHCGAVAALYDPPPEAAPNLARWLRLARDARLDLDGAPDAEDLRRTERRSVALQVGRLADYPLVRDRVDDGELTLHGWHYLLEEGRVEALDRDRGAFRPLGAG
jgi:carbonic anhydrase